MSPSARVDANGSTVRQAIFYRIAGTSEPASYAFGLSTSQSAAGGIVAYSGVDPANPIDVAGGLILLVQRDGRRPGRICHDIRLERDGITWSNRPARTGGALADRGSITSGTWVEYDVTGAVSGNGNVSLVLATTSTDGVDFRSREYRTVSQRPQLVVTFRP
jgi:hypothetical protein